MLHCSICFIFSLLQFLYSILFLSYFILLSYLLPGGYPDRAPFKAIYNRIISMARYTASFPRTTSNSAVQDDGDCCKKRQGKKGSADIRSMTYCGERILVQVHVYWVPKHLQESTEILDYILAVLWIIKCNVWAVRRVLHFWSMYLTDRE